MADPWNTAEPFSPMFSETVEVSGSRAKGQSFRGSFSACVYPVEDEEPFADTDADSDLRHFRLLVTKMGRRGWNKPYPPQIGDQVKLKNGSKWKVSKMEDRQFWFELEARNC